MEIFPGRVIYILLKTFKFLPYLTPLYKKLILFTNLYKLNIPIIYGFYSFT